MLIRFDENTQVFHLQGKTFSYIMQLKDGLLLHLYWGKKIPMGHHEALLFLPWEGASFDSAHSRWPLEVPTQEKGYFGRRALDIVNAALFEAVPQNKRQLLELKYKLMICSVETPEDVYAAAEIGYQMIDADLRLSPKVKESRKRQLRGVFANPQTSINRSRIIHRKRPIR